jgi:predicted amidohydrolase YtcJ
VIDLDGAAAVPGLIDSHMHPFMGAIGARGADLPDAHTLDEVRGALSADRARCAPGEWVRGWGLDYNVFEQTGISAEVIDQAVGGAPAALTFMDFHTLLASSAALTLAGVDGPRAFAEHAEVVCVDGRPTGELRENAAMGLVRRAMPVPTAREEYELCANHLRRLAAVGLTGTHAMDGTLASLERLRALESRGGSRDAQPRAVHDRARHARGDVGGLRGRRRRARTLLASRGGEVLHRRRDRFRDRLAGRP